MNKAGAYRHIVTHRDLTNLILKLKLVLSFSHKNVLFLNNMNMNWGPLKVQASGIIHCYTCHNYIFLTVLSNGFSGK